MSFGLKISVQHAVLCIGFYFVLWPAYGQSDRHNEVAEENRSASQAPFSPELRELESAALRSSIEQYQERFGRVQSDQPLIILVADHHDHMDEFRQILRRASETARLLGMKEVVLLHLGDSSNGTVLSEVEESVRIPAEFGIPKDDAIFLMGNSEYRGQGELTLSDEERWRNQVMPVMTEHITLITILDEHSGKEQPLPDDQMAVIEFHPDLRIAVSHKPLHLLQHHYREAHSAVPRLLGTINYRNWVGAPIVFATITIPGLVVGVPLSFVPLRANSKAILPDIWKPFGSSLQFGLDLVRGKAFRSGYKAPKFFQISGPWFSRDSRSRGERLRDRLRLTPRIDPETAFTMRRNVPVPSDIPAVFHAHTHRGHSSVRMIANEKGQLQVRRHIGVPPAYMDEHVPHAAPGWVSIVSINGQPHFWMHRSDRGGWIEIGKPLDALQDPDTDWSQVSPSYFSMPQANACQRMLGRARALKSWIDLVTGRVKDFGQGLENATQEQSRP